MSINAWEQFYQLLQQDQLLQEKLTAAYNRDMAIALAIELGEEEGYSFTASDIVEAIASDREDLSESDLAAVAGGHLGMALPRPDFIHNPGCLPKPWRPVHPVHPWMRWLA